MTEQLLNMVNKYGGNLKRIIKAVKLNATALTAKYADTNTAMMKNVV